MGVDGEAAKLARILVASTGSADAVLVENVGECAETIERAMRECDVRGWSG